MIEPKVQDRPKRVLDLEEPKIKIGPGKLFSDLDYGLGQQAKIVRSYNTGPKGVLGPEDFLSCGSGQNYKMDQLRDFCNH